MTGECITAGGAVSKPAECGGGPDTTGTSSEVTTLLPEAGPDAAAFSAFLAALPATQNLPSINLKSGGSTTLNATAGSGLNVIDLPSITTGAKATITINGSANAFVVVNVGTPGLLTLGDSSSVMLSGGITPDKVVFNVEGGGGPVQLGNNTTFNGTILAPRQGFIAGNGDTLKPLVINGALLLGQGVSIGNNVNVSFYPLTQIARPLTIRLIGTVDVMQLPPPPPRGPVNESDDFFPGPHIDEVPGQPGPPIQPLPISIDPPAALHALSTIAPAVLNPTLVDQFAIVGLGNLNRRTPPDTQIAAGQATLVEMVNRTGALYDKFSGNQIFNTFNLGEAFGGSSNQGTDPRVLYDAQNQSFFAAYELGRTGGDDIRLAVADDPIVATGFGGIEVAVFPWSIYGVDSNSTDICFDQPKLGISNTMVALSWNDYKNSSSCANTPGSNFTGSEYLVIRSRIFSTGPIPPSEPFGAPTHLAFRSSPPSPYR